MSNFKIILIAIFLVFAIVGVLIFSGVIPVGNQSGVSGASGSVVIWGTIDARKFNKLLEDVNRNNRNLTISYIEKYPQKFDKELTEALAVGRGPDIFLLSNDSILLHMDKVFPIPYQSFSASDFRRIFIQEGELYFGSDGIWAYPLTIDPMVMYYNRDMLDSAGIASPPKRWDEFYALTPLLTSKDASSNITKSTISFGGFDNIDHAKDIISMLLLQLGNPIITQKDNIFISAFNSALNLPVKPATAVLDFYTDFSDPLSEVYSWNRSLVSSRDAFISGDLAFYFGYASELFPIQQSNPNLNFDITKIPQPKNANSNITIGRIDALAVSRASQNLNSAFVVTSMLSAQDFSQNLAIALSLPPVRRDLLLNTPGGAYLPIFYDSALQSRGWLDPSPEDTDQIFREMIEDVITGKSKSSEAASMVDGRLNLLLRR